MFLQASGVLTSLLLGVTLLLCVRLMHGDPWSPPREGLLVWLQLAGRGLLVAALVAGYVAFQGSAIAIGFVVVTLFILARALVRAELARQSMLLRALATAADHGLPLTQAIMALAHEGQRRFHRRAALLAERMQAGLSLDEALADRRLRFLAPPTTGVTAHIGEQVGRLPAALHELADVTQREEDLRGTGRDRLANLVGVLCWTLAISVFIAVKILPSLRSLAADFNMQAIPRVFELMLHIASGPRVIELAIGLNVLLLAWYVWLTVARPTMHLIWALGLFQELWNRYRPAARRQLSPAGGTALRLLAHTVEAGAPLEPSLAVMASEFPQRFMRRKLDQAAQRLAQGEKFSAALESARLTSTAETALVASAERLGNLAWALRQLAAARDRRWQERLRWLAEIANPLALLLVASLVGLLAGGMIWFLASLIDQGVRL